MKDIEKNRFLVWLMYLIPIALTGGFSIIVWTVVQIFLCNKEIEKRKMCGKPLKEREEVIEMNKKENLTEKDLEIMKKTGAAIKLKEGVYLYDWK